MDRGRRCSSCPPDIESDPALRKKVEPIEVPLENDDECAICLEVIDTRKEGDDEASLEAFNETLRMLPCKHVFHKKCLYLWLLNNPSCPICRWSPPVVEDDDDEE